MPKAGLFNCRNGSSRSQQIPFVVGQVVPRHGPWLGRKAEAEVAHDVRGGAQPRAARADQTALVVEEGADAAETHGGVGAKPVVQAWEVVKI